MTGEQVTGSEFSGGEVKETIRKELTVRSRSKTMRPNFIFKYFLFFNLFYIFLFFLNCHGIGTLGGDD